MAEAVERGAPRVGGVRPYDEAPDETGTFMREAHVPQQRPRLERGSPEAMGRAQELEEIWGGRPLPMSSYLIRSAAKHAADRKAGECVISALPPTPMEVAQAWCHAATEDVLALREALRRLETTMALVSHRLTADRHPDVDFRFTTFDDIGSHLVGFAHEEERFDVDTFLRHGPDLLLATLGAMPDERTEGELPAEPDTANVDIERRWYRVMRAELGPKYSCWMGEFDRACNEYMSLFDPADDEAEGGA